MTALALSVLRSIVENGLKMEKVYVYLPQVNAAFSNIFASILRRSPISRQRLTRARGHLNPRSCWRTFFSQKEELINASLISAAYPQLL